MSSNDQTKKTHFLEFSFQIKLLDSLVGFFKRYGVIWSMEKIYSNLAESQHSP